MTSRNTLGFIATAVALAIIGSTAVGAESMGNPGYLFDQRGHVVVNNYGECWKTPEWTPAHAIRACDPQYFTKATAPPPAPATQAVVERVTLSDGSTTYFSFNGSTLRPEGKDKLDEVVQLLNSFQRLDRVTVSGYTDPIGNDEYNRLLSERRAATVKDYLVAHGIDGNLITTRGLGETELVTTCDGKQGSERIACYQPNRRVEIEIAGEKGVDH
jgi:OOP family OmpA-OmpF porin